MKIQQYIVKVDAHVDGYLYDSDDPAELGQDMLVIRLPSGISVDVGWYPEGDPDGSYRIAVWRGLEFLRRPIRANTLDQVERDLDRLLDELSSDMSYSSSADDFVRLSPRLVNAG